MAAIVQSNHSQVSEGLACPLDIPLMSNNITAQDRAALIDFLDGDPMLTQSSQVARFEAEWSEWLGVKYSVFVNSGSSANLITLHALAEQLAPGEVILPTLTWVSDCASVLHAGFTPVFVDINLANLGMNVVQVLEKITPKTRIVFLTHAQGMNALNEELIDYCQARGIVLVEDVCESHGALFKDNKLGTFGLVSNFSFYYAHHMSTVEGGMVCTNDESLYQRLRMWRSHGMVREASDPQLRQQLSSERPDLNDQFIFSCPGFNVRSSELNAVIGRSQLARLDDNNQKRRKNFELFLARLDPTLYVTEFAVEGSCSYALLVILREANPARRDSLEKMLTRRGVEYRRGLSGGGNQLRQPYLDDVRKRSPANEVARYPVVEHVHFYGYYLGNYPDLSSEKIVLLAEALNQVDEVDRETGI